MQSPARPAPTAGTTLPCTYVHPAASFWAVQVAHAPGAQHHANLCGPGIAICRQQLPCQGARCPDDRASQDGTAGSRGRVAFLWDLTLTPQTIPFLPLPGLSRSGASRGVLPLFRQRRGWSSQTGIAGRGAGGSGEPPINANHFPYATCFCRRGCLAISGYRVPFCFHSLGLCDLSF